MNVVHKDTEVLDFCKANNIVYQAWAPLGEGNLDVLTAPPVVDAAYKHGKTPAQIALRWILEKGAVISVQSTSSEHQLQNMAIFNWTLTPEEVRNMDELPNMQLAN